MIGRSNERAQYRATASSAIFEIEYGCGWGSIGVAERVVLAERVPRVGVRLVDGDRRHHQRRLGLAAVLEQEAGALGVDAQRPLVVVGAEVGGDVQQVGEVGREVAEVAVGEVDRSASSPRAPRPRRGSPGRRSGRCPTPRCRRERPGEPERDPPGRPGDQDLLAAQHDGRPSDL